MTSMAAGIGRFGIALLLGMAAPGVAQAAEEAYCSSFGSLTDKPAPTLAKVSGPDRVHFIEEPGAKASPCPDLSPACRAKAFLVPGDRVIVSRTRGPLTCVDYMNPKGAVRSGWLPSQSLAPEPTGPVALADWHGTWTAIESTIKIQEVAGGTLKIDGDATYGALDPDRVKRGAVNIGSMAATIAPDGDSLAFTMGDDKTLPITGGTDSDCRVWLRRLGPYLLADDNNMCGGMNVTFRNIYIRKP